MVLHLYEHLFVMIKNYGTMAYVILFIIIFVEIGLVVMPFLPGDSPLFVAGAICAGVVNETGESAQLSLALIVGSLFLAAVVGDCVNYWIGKNIGLKVLHWEIKGYKLVKDQ